MQCFYCGREIPEGAMFCECGHPVKQYAGDMAGGSYGAVVTPMTRQKRSVLPTIIGIVIALALAGGLIFFKSRNSDEYKITHKDQWETKNQSLYSITIPKGMKDGDIVEIGEAKGLDLFFSNDAAVMIGVEYYPEGVSSVTADEIEALLKGRKRSINNEELVPQRKGDINYYEYDKTSKTLIGKSDDLRAIESYIPGKKGVYQVHAYCARSDYSKYKEYMFEWIESFKEK